MSGLRGFSDADDFLFRPDEPGKWFAETVDVYGDKIREHAHNPEALAKIAEVFYSRMTWSKHLPRYPDSAEITGDGVMRLVLGDLVLECKRHNDGPNAQWTLRDISVECGAQVPPHNRELGEILRESKEKVHIVDCLKVPFPYLCGIFDALALSHAGKVLIDEANRLSVSEARKISPTFFDRRFHVAVEEYARVTAELRTAHAELAEIKASPRDIERCSVAANCYEYPPPPEWRMPHAAAVVEFRGVSGVYIAYEGDAVAYVGRSRDIGRRLASHHKVSVAHAISVVRMENAETHLAELYYIAMLRPPLNSQSQQASDASEPITDRDLADAVSRLPYFSKESGQDSVVESPKERRPQKGGRKSCKA